MLEKLRRRPIRFTGMLIYLLIPTVAVYLVLSSLTVTNSVTPKQSKHEQSCRMTNNTLLLNTNSSRSSTAVKSIRVPVGRKYEVRRTVASVANSSSNGKTDTEDDGQAETGAEETEQVPTYKQGDVERHVRREVTRLRPRPPKRVRYSHGKWQVVAAVGGNVYMYSAFYDARANVDWPQVRIIAVAEQTVDLFKLCCLLWYRSHHLPDVAEIRTLEVGLKYSSQGEPIPGQYIFSCRIDRNKTDPPTYVSVVTANSFQLSNLLPVQVPERPKHVIEFGHCMNILYWKQDLFRLVEWLEAYRLWGVGEVNIYTTQIDNVTDNILKWYSNTGFVKYRQSPGPIGDFDDKAIRLSMSAVINDCLYRNMYRYRYVVCTDLDEMIVPASPHHNYSEMLRAADAEATLANALIHSYSFRNTYFFLDFGAADKQPSYLLSGRHVFCSTSICMTKIYIDRISLDIDYSLHVGCSFQCLDVLTKCIVSQSRVFILVLSATGWID